MRTLHRKLLRDLWHLKAQITAISTVLAAGVMVLTLMHGLLDAVSLAQQQFYQRAQFADISARLTRAPQHLKPRLQAISGVDHVSTRLEAAVRLRVPGFAPPVRGVALSLPDGRQPELNRLHLYAGRLPVANGSAEVVVSEPFARAHGLRPGASLTAIISGRKQQLRISGIAMSPEFIYQLGPGELMPDHERFTPLWLHDRVLAQPLDLDSAFNSVLLRLTADASNSAVIAALDQLLAPYGGQGAHDRSEQTSHRFLEQELISLRVMASVVPLIFFGAAAFLIHVLMARLVRQQHQQIAVLKAFGYRNVELAQHFALLVLVIAGLGLGAGLLLGSWAGQALAALFTEYYRFPAMPWTLRPIVVLLAAAVALAAAGLGAGQAVARAIRQAPAEAMRPPLPETFRHNWIDRLQGPWAPGRALRITLRNLHRHRLKTGFSIAAVAVSSGLMLVGGFQFGAVNQMLDQEYRLRQRASLQVTFTEAVSTRALTELRALPGVLYAEGYRTVAVRLHHGNRSFRTAAMGMAAQPELYQVITASGRRTSIPADGIVLTRFLATRLALQLGDRVQLEQLGGRRQRWTLPVVAFSDDPVGVNAYLQRTTLNRALGESATINGAWLLVEAGAATATLDRLDALPAVAGISNPADTAAHIRAYVDDTLLTTMAVLMLLAGSIAFAVIYNNARVAFAERSRELATLRVMGFSMAEVSRIMAAESVLVTAIAIPLGWLVGTGFAWSLNQAMTMELMRIPFVITPRTYALSALGVVLASTIATLLLLRRLRNLALVDALNTGE